MNELTRSTIEQWLRSYLNGEAKPPDLAAWALEEFYAEAEGRIRYEVGYKALIGSTLDDLMFGDQPFFPLTPEHAHQLLESLVSATMSTSEVINEQQDDEPDHG
ncbi:MAG: hypothetical protein NVS2B7_31760 [Herpetosiphon sp.]